MWGRNWLGLTDKEFEKGLVKRKCTTVNLLEGKATGHVQDGLIDGLRKLSPLLQPAFKAWWETGVVLDVGPHHGYMLTDLIINRPSRVTSGVAGGFVALNELLENPREMTEHLESRRYDHLS